MTRTPAHDPTAAPQLLLDLGPTPDATLDNFVAGPNADVLRVLRALRAGWLAGTALENRFAYVWGPKGSGKSHLASALKRGMDEAGRGIVADNLRVVDEVQRLDAVGQAALMDEYHRRLPDARMGIVAFGDRPPAELDLMPELSSRLGWGLVFALTLPDERGLRRALVRLSEERQIHLDDAVVDYLITHTARDIASMKGLVERLAIASLQQGRRVTVPLLRELLNEAPAPR